MAEADLGFLKVEAVNFENAIFDTNQLSVVRGSSYALKQIIIQIEKRLVQAKLPNYEAVTTASSTGIFCCEPKSMSKLRNIVKSYLNSKIEIDKVYFVPNELFTFVVNDVIANNYLIAKEQLTALGRFKQASSFSHALPNFDTNAHSACALNGFLAADSDQKSIKASKDSKVSQSVNTRYRIGCGVRAGIYKQEREDACSKLSGLGAEWDERLKALPDIDEYSFPSDLETLAGCHPKMSINGKVAVIYSDGNAFGEAQRKAIEDAKGKRDPSEVKQEFDLKIRLERARYLTHLVDFLASKGALIEKDGKKIVLLETLLWGGDEMTLVVPAWIGLEVLLHYSENYMNVAICEQKLTSSTGIVFCSHKTPIRKAEQAARELADAIKGRAGGRGESYFDYMVLESIDYPTQSLDDFWTTQYGPKIAKHRLPLKFNPDVQFLHKRVATHLEALPRSGIYKLVDSALHHQLKTLADPEHTDKQTALQQKGTADELPLRKQRLLEAGGQPLTQALNALMDIFLVMEEGKSPKPFSDQDTLFWLHILELYDYLAPGKPAMEGR